MNRVLIVEDDLTIARIYQGLMRMEGCEPVVAGDGELAIQSLTDRPPDLVLLDLMIPKKNGVEVLKHIRSTPELKDLPVVVFTNACMGTLVQEAVDAGATKCLIKAQTAPKQLMQALRVYFKPATEAKPAPVSTPVALAPAPAAPPSALPVTAITAAAPAAPETTPPPSLVSPPAEVDAPAPPSPAAPVLDAPAPELASDSASASSLEPETNEVESVSDQSDIRQQLLARAPGMLKALRNELHSLAKVEDEAGRRSRLESLGQSVRALSKSAGLVNLTAIAQMASALENLLAELQRSFDKLNPSTLRTTAQGFDCMDALFAAAASDDQNDRLRAPLILALDDDAICRKLIWAALNRAKLPVLRLDDPALALRVLTDNSFDLIFLDVMMPGMDGFELCKKIRASDNNKEARVVFVTSLSNLDTRALSILSGGNDFIGKPFVPAELIVKAFVHVLAPRRTEPARPTASQSPVEATRPSEGAASSRNAAAALVPA